MRYFDFAKFSTKPGVYLMKNHRGLVLYVGKAKNLRQRIRQYFVPGGDGRVMVPFLVSHVAAIDTIIVSSEKEALLLENTLIKQHKPRFNALLKDDKSYIALKMTKHEWPRVDIVRYRGKPKADGTYFGPYTHAGAARKTLDLLHRIFPLRQCSDQEFLRRTRPCILYDIKRCVAPCVGYCTKEEYDDLVKKTTRFLRGQDKEIVKELYHEMHTYSDALEFEKAGAVWKKIQQIEKTVEGQHVDKPLGVNADAIGLFRQGDEVILSQLFFRDGRLTGTRHYNFAKIAQDDDELIQTFLLQHYEKLETRPKEILVPVPITGAEIIEEILSLHIHTPQRGHKKAITKMAYANAEATFRKEKDEKAILERTLLQIQEKFKLTRYPRRIECFDISKDVATRVAFTDGKKDTARYRKYQIKTIIGMDDYGAMYEVLTRRFKKNDYPDLLIVDGGKGHLNVALKVMQEQNIISVDVIALVKEEGRHDRGMTGERVFLPNVKDPIPLKRTSPILFLLQQIRDEAHRTAITFQRKRRVKTTVKSALDEIPGIGPAKRQRLLRHFGSLKKIREATLEEIAAVKGISAKDAQAIHDFC